MTDTTERIWVDDERHIGGAVHVESEWTELVAKYSVEYVRADMFASLQAENQRLRNALEAAAQALDDYSPLTGNTIETFASRAARAALLEQKENNNY